MLLPALLGATLDQTAAALGVGHATVSRLQQGFRQRCSAATAAPAPTWGGRRHSWMTFEQEQEFLAPWLKSALAGSLVVVAPVRAALAQRVGHPIKASVVYRMLARHGGAKSRPPPATPRAVPPHSKSGKKLPAARAALLQPAAVKGRRVRLMFQDEARFGRRVRIRRCWAPAPSRPVVDNGYAREFT